MNLQSNYDLSRAEAKVGSRIAREIERNPAATLQI
jgi:plasmid maintenance system antidote protein VapI